jgi:pimeloyl-ACP methyl ester carboxylesterase
VKKAVQQVGAIAGRGARSLLSPSGLRGTVTEAAWIAAHVATYPLGVGQERSRTAAERFTLAGLPPVRRGLLIGDVEAAGTPILLVPGLVDNRSIFTVLRRALRPRGFGRVWTLNYHVLTQDLRAAARRLEQSVEAICEQTGYERIHVIGHSMGGIIARYYVQRMGGDERVHTLVTLGSPHGGTRAARLMPRGVCRQLRPSSDVIAELAAHQLAKEAKHHQRAVDACVAAARKRAPSVAGSLTLDFDIADRKVQSVRVSDDAVHDPALAACVSSVARSFSFAIASAHLRWPVPVR